MHNPEAVINEFDKTRLEDVIDLLSKENNHAPWAAGDALREKLARARAIPPDEMPEDIVTMNSILRTRDLDSGKEETYNLVFPWESQPVEGRISVLSSLGLALYGVRIGDQVSWETRNGRKQLEVIEIVYQPEAARHYTL